MYALFYRNLNLGHAGSPDRRGLEQALLDAGASAARSFQTNGTVLLTADDPQRSVMGAAHSLRADCCCCCVTVVIGPTLVPRPGRIVMIF
jgi:hypothetical protein